MTELERHLTQALNALSQQSGAGAEAKVNVRGGLAKAILRLERQVRPLAQEYRQVAVDYRTLAATLGGCWK